jgi:hypothetical protein
MILWRRRDGEVSASSRLQPLPLFANHPTPCAICLGAQTTAERVERALARLAELLATPPERYLAVV